MRLHWLRGIFIVIGLLVVFQLFFRYQYVSAGGIVWRIDRLTQDATRVEEREPNPSSTVSAGGPIQWNTPTPAPR